MATSAPPRLIRAIAARCLAPADREFLLGDLDEGFAARAAASGAPIARRWYRRQVALAVWHGLGRRRPVPAGARPSQRSLDMSHWWRDIRLGVRTLRRTPVYTAVAVLTLALAIGANTVLFGIANPLLIRALPIKDEQTLGWLLLDNANDPNVRGTASVPQFLEWRARTVTLQQLAARESHGATLTGHGDAEHVTVMGVTANLCELWGLHSVLGRLIGPGDDLPGAAPVVLLSHHYWLNTFQGDRSVIGKTYFLDSHAVTVAGVMEPELETYGYSQVDVWAPERLDPTASRSAHALRIMGRLAPGATFASATAEFKALVAESARLHPDTDAGWTARIVDTHTAMTSPETWILMGLLAIVVGFVLLIACANLANLVLARIVARRSDLAVRQGLGASRVELIRPLIVESLLVSLAGGVLALGFASAVLRIINATSFDALLQRVDIDTNVLLFTAALSILTPLLFSLWPALGVGGESVADVLRQSRTSGGRSTERRRNILVGVQVSLALCLLVMSGLILKTVVNVQRLDPGFDLSHELTFRIEPPADRYADDSARTALAMRLVDRLAATPGISAATIVTHLPVFDGDVLVTFEGTPHDGTRPSERPVASSYAISPAFFTTMGMHMIAGRAFADTDLGTSEPVAIVSRLTAEKYFDKVPVAVGRVITLPGPDARRVRIVGVVSDTHSSQVTNTVPQIYFPITQRPVSAVSVVIRADRPGDRATDAREVMREVDSNVAISMPKTFERLVDENTGDNWIVGGMFLGFAILALTLAGGGLYGVIAYSVGLRQREIGVRLALGAAPFTVGRLIFVQSLRVTAIGVAIGLGLAWLLAHAAGSVLYGVGPNDPGTFGGVTALVFVVSVTAVFGPVMRAMRVDPAVTLRSE
jgi:predicted permease